MTEDIDLDPSSSDLRVGVEIEWPRAPNWDKVLTSYGRNSNSLRDHVRNDGLPSRLGGRPVHDGTVGLEIVSPQTGPEGGMALGDAWKWYADVIDYVEEEYAEPYNPVGLMENNTAGLHIHISPLTREQADELYKLSTTVWAKVLFCSSIVSDDGRNDWRVFRGGQYCDFRGGVTPHGSGDDHYSCVNYRGGDHYEWRMPEPMFPEHFELVTKFLRLFEQDTEEAIRFAQELLDSGDDRITAIRRAEAVGIDIEERPSVARAPVPETRDFYEAVANEWALPEIHQVNLIDDHFYVFDSRLNAAFEVDDVEFTPDDVLYADTLEPVQDDQLADDILRAFSNRGGDTINETEATHVVKDIVKTKKGKA